MMKAGGIVFEKQNGKWVSMYGGWRTTMVSSGSYVTVTLEDPLAVATASHDLEANGWAGYGRGYVVVAHAATLEQGSLDAQKFIAECHAALSSPTPLRSPR